MIEALAILFASGVGFGLACWLMGTLLDKSNNIGDSHGNAGEYGAYIAYTQKMNRMSNTDRDRFCNLYSIKIDLPSEEPKGSDLVRRLTKEELEKYKGLNTEKVPPITVNRDVFNGGEDEFKLWEDQNAGTNLSGVFKPLDED